MTLADDIRKWRASRNASNDPEKEKVQDEDTESSQDGIVIRNVTPDAPNISLNCHRSSGRAELRVVAVFATILQIGVLVYSGFATYHPALSFKKDDNAGYELDWLAKTLGKLDEAPWAAGNKDVKVDLALAAKLGMKSVTSRGIAQFEKDEQNRGEFEASVPLAANRGTPIENGSFDVQKVLDARMGLGYLADWSGPAFTEAVSLARAIEITLNAMFGSSTVQPSPRVNFLGGTSPMSSPPGQPFPAEPPPRGSPSRDSFPRTFYWSLEARYGGSTSLPIRFELQQEEDGQWKAFVPEYNDVDDPVNELPNFDGEQKGDSLLATESYGPLPLMFAQHLFSTFMHAVANTEEPQEPFQKKATVQSEAGEASIWGYLTLHSTTLSAIAREIQVVGIGTLEDIYLSMIPPLSKAKKLPRADTNIEVAREEAEPHEQMGQWERGFQLNSILFYTAASFPDEVAAVKATAIFMDFLRQLSLTIALRDSEDDFELSKLQRLKVKTEEQLEEHGDQKIVSGLMALYKTQQREWHCALVHEAGGQPEPLGNISEMLGYSVQHHLAHKRAIDERTITLHSDKFTREWDDEDALRWTPLHYAAAAHFLGSVAHLLRSAADVNARDLSGWTSLHYSCHSADVNAKGRDGMAPLHCAAIAGDEMVVVALIEAGANVDIQDALGKTSLFWAIYKSHSDVAKTLLEMSDKRLRSNDGRTVSHVAALVGEILVAESLFGEGTFNTKSRDREMQRPLHLAARNGHTDMVAFLLEQGAEMNTKDSSGYTPLHVAANRGHTEMVAYLIEQKAEMEARDFHSQTPLHLAAAEGNTETVVYLIEQGADKEAEHFAGRTPLKPAVRRKHEDVVRVLVGAGSKIDVAGGTDQWTALHIAAYLGHTVNTKILLDAGAKTDSLDWKGQTPLFAAIGGPENDIGMLNLLVDYGAEVNHKDRNGITPLHYASIEGAVRPVRFLLEKGADKASRNEDGKTPVEVAVEIRQAIIDNDTSRIWRIGTMNDAEIEELIREYDDIIPLLE
ncbi:ankyrin repeat protein [Colletotrichum sojae]|uniref:Ankyrin repeat protein n=1 Tax=Colletotrichum sojae TaxID=2175907 RepID=A0A8H6IWR9_9PEZI|nr:ankyrin repeat protein [Colletotrichum sojae]